MSQDISKPVSLINNYFSLADGLVPGFENCLAENVVLDWFGKTIRGRKNVAAFMKTHKVNSRHLFNSVTSTTKIGYNKTDNKRNRSVQQLMSPRNKLRSKKKITPSEYASNPDRSRSSTKIDNEGNFEDSFMFELHDDDLSTLFQLKNIKETDVKEIEDEIKKISIEDTVKLDNEKNEDDESPKKKSCIETSKMKFIEAIGEIQFSKRRSKRFTEGGYNHYNTRSSAEKHTWSKPCKLQIAHTFIETQEEALLSINNNEKEVDYFNPKTTNNNSQLLNFQKINELSNQLIPNDNNFAGHLRRSNIIEENDVFFKNFENYLSSNNMSKSKLSPNYIDGELVLENTDSSKNLDNQIFKNKYLIYIIIYEGKSKCRKNLSQRFV